VDVFASRHINARRSRVRTWSSDRRRIYQAVKITRVRIVKVRRAGERARPAGAGVTDVRSVAMLLATLATACAVEPTTLDIPNADPKVFEEKVYPVLLADCGFNTCHGNPERFFSVFGPGRARLDPMTGAFDPPTPSELAHSYARAESMLIGPRGPRSSLLIRKPVPIAQGGAGHKGDDLWGGTVYDTVDDPHFVTIYSWATAATAATP
jgi:hypothetical protein